MATRTSSAEWMGSLKEGQGRMRLGSGAYEGPYSYASRFESGPGTNPEELIGAAHAGCFSMALSAALSAAGFIPRRVSTKATVHLDAGPKITLIELETEADVPKLGDEAFQGYAEDARKNCPVSKALAGTEIRLKAKLIK
jgi:lipoyl-dependent peroxiredoxin